jgi:hypothetical protein
MSRLIVVAFPLLAACGACDAASLASGVTDGGVDGAGFTTSDTTWDRAGTGVQIFAGSDGNWTLTIIGQVAEDGVAVGDAVEANTFPIEVELVGSGTGFATVYPADGSTSFTSNGGSGHMTIDDLDNGELVGCFEFSAVGDDGSVGGKGAFRAAQPEEPPPP